MTDWALGNKQCYYCSELRSPPTCRKQKSRCWIGPAPTVSYGRCAPHNSMPYSLWTLHSSPWKRQTHSRIKSVVASRCDGNIELERAEALRDWCTLTMREGEDIVDYGGHSVKLCERLTSTGVPEPQRPRPKEQSLRFIDGLSNSISTYLDYKNYLSNSLTVTGVDIYPATLVAAINSVTKFHRGTKAPQSKPPSGTMYTTLAALEGEKPKGKPRGGRDRKPGTDKDKSTPD
jgi:hypothetical protein